MREKKNKFLTFICAMLPGAGHMYIGFMKMGVSLMSMFLFTMFIADWFSEEALLFILPLIWFYSFFDCINKSGLDDEQFLLLEDKYLYSIDNLFKLDKNIFKSCNLFIGLLVLFLGISLLFKNIIYVLQPYISNGVYNFIADFMRKSPKIIIGVGIVVLGLRLIKGKKVEREVNA